MLARCVLPCSVMKKKTKQSERKNPATLDEKQLAQTRGGYFELHGATANEVLLNAWWDAGATQ